MATNCAATSLGGRRWLTESGPLWWSDELKQLVGVLAGPETAHLLRKGEDVAKEGNGAVKNMCHLEPQ
jgi:hypothetical protein